MTDQLASLIRAVEEADSASLLLKAVQNLADARLEGAIPTLIAMLNDNNPAAATVAVEGLVSLGELAVPALLTHLDLPNYTARTWIIRALADIGDPRGLIVLLGVATADFALSVRRVAARGLGMMKWDWFSQELREIAQEEALETLLFVAQQDEAWVVRYAAIVGLQALAAAISLNHLDWRSQIQTQFDQIAVTDSSWAVRGRVWMAQQSLKAESQVPSLVVLEGTLERSAAQSLSLCATNWRTILDKLYERKGHERLVLAEGDPRRYRELAVVIAENFTKADNALDFPSASDG